MKFFHRAFINTQNHDFSSFYWLIQAGPKAAPPYPSLAAAKEAGAVTLNYGQFINSVVSFLIVAFAVFLVVRSINRLRRKQAETPTPKTRDCPKCCMPIPLAATRCGHCTSEVARSA
ncbi:MAG: MscL family protein [Candidatus Binatia bacterium]